MKASYFIVLGAFASCLLEHPPALGGTSFTNPITKAIRPSDAHLESIVRQRAIVLLKDDSNISEVISRLPPKFVIISRMDHLFIVQTREKISEDDLKLLQTLPGVEKALADRIAPISSEMVSCHSDSSMRDAEDKIKCFQPILGNNCQSNKFCTSDSNHGEWALEAIDADLMRTELAKVRIDGSNVRVAVIDTGFDPPSGTTAGSVTLSKGTTTAGNAAVDEAGHGTATAELIAEKENGIVPNPHLHFYRPAPAGSLLGAAGSDLLTTINRACQEHAEVINVSYELPYEMDRAALKSIRGKGCLLILAAGNSNVRNESRSIDSPLLDVVATTPTGSEALFSSTGDISAPGQSVKAVKSKSTASDSVMKPVPQCGDSDHIVVDGTSFAAPIVSGIAVDIIATLKSGSAYASLSAKDRIKLTNHILYASQHEFGDSSVNGLRAVILAERWKNQKLFPVPSVSEIERSLTNPPEGICSVPADPSCKNSENGLDCRKFNNCFNTLRSKIALCKSVPQDTFKALMNSAYASGNLELTTHMLYLAKQRHAPTEALRAPLGWWKNTENDSNPSKLLADINEYGFYTKTTADHDPDFESRLLDNSLKYLSTKPTKDEEIQFATNYVAVVQQLSLDGLITPEYLKRLIPLTPSFSSSDLKERFDSVRPAVLMQAALGVQMDFKTGYLRSIHSPIPQAEALINLISKPITEQSEFLKAEIAALVSSSVPQKRREELEESVLAKLDETSIDRMLVNFSNEAYNDSEPPRDLLYISNYLLKNKLSSEELRNLAEIFGPDSDGHMILTGPSDNPAVVAILREIESRGGAVGNTIELRSRSK